eukprot:2894527-Rhodomonas_salina.2
MKAKGVIRDALSWKRSREYFYWRVNRRLAELKLRKEVMAADPNLTFEEVTASMKEMVSCDWDDDKAVIQELEANNDKIAEKVSGFKIDGITKKIETTLNLLPADARANLLERLR